MADIDTSFYPKAPTSSPFEMAQQVIGTANLAEQNKLLGTQNKQSQLDLVNNQVGTLVKGFSTLASVPDLSPQHFEQFGRRMVEEGVISPDIFNAEMKQVMSSGGDPNALRQLAQNYSLRALDAGQQFSAQYGTPQLVDTGNQLMPTTVSPMTGIHPIGGGIGKTLSPSELAAPATIGTTPEGQPIQGTQGQFLEAAGVNPLTARPEPLNPNNPLLPVEPQQPGVVTTLPAGAVEAQKAVGEQAGQVLAADQARERTFQQDITPLQKAIVSLEALGKTGTGPGTEQLNEIKSFLQSMGIPGLDVENIKDFDEARKYLTQYAQAVGDTGTNDKLAASFAGNPSVGISNAAAVDVAKTALALRRLQNAAVVSFQGSPDQYLKYATEFNASQDPRAYGLDLMTPENRNKLISSLKGDEKAKFAQSLRKAMQLGLVTPPGGASGQ